MIDSTPMVVMWPRDAHLRAEAAAAGVPCLLVVAEGAPAPPVGRGEDWVRDGADERWVASCLAQLAAVGRHRGAIVPPVLPASLHGAARDVAAVLTAAPGELVPRSELEAAAPGRLARVLPAVRRALAPLGWTIDAVPGTGYVLEPVADP